MTVTSLVNGLRVLALHPELIRGNEMVTTTVRLLGGVMMVALLQLLCGHEMIAGAAIGIVIGCMLQWSVIHSPEELGSDSLVCIKYV